MSKLRCRCRSDVEPSLVWDGGLLELGTEASLLAWMDHRINAADAAQEYDAAWALELDVPLVRKQRDHGYAAVGIWSSGSLMAT